MRYTSAIEDRAFISDLLGQLGDGIRDVRDEVVSFPSPKPSCLGLTIGVQRERAKWVTDCMHSPFLATRAPAARRLT